ncbi:uncharacterized protein LAJ45_10730 [Morchella importuna]|uniref:uncharacterized protein n=1 Tax=Morchella importuna TaxID=1174673 RepID=UPI001E8D6079|nr:uncharacterized protein LAJ45_10730 [Morchella importuna]KAH8145293.1 hypothetical protein LAJ45_10730 [Morchella importuna]
MAHYWRLLGILLASLPMGSVHINAVPLDYSGEERDHDSLDSPVAQTSLLHDTISISLKDQKLYFSVRQKDWQKVENMDWQKVENFDWPREEYIDRLEVDKMDLKYHPSTTTTTRVRVVTVVVPPPEDHSVLPTTQPEITSEVPSVDGIKIVENTWVPTKTPTVGSTIVDDKLFVPWGTKKQTSTSTLVTRTSILYVICFIMAVSVLYVIGYGLYTAFTRCKSWFTSCFRANLDELSPVRLEESAGVSWTDGSNLSSPQPGVQELEERGESWAETRVDTNRLGIVEASGTAAMLASATGTIRRHNIRSTSRGDEVLHEKE